MVDTASDQWLAADIAVHELQANGYEGYLIGGAVRDILLGRRPKDFDVVTNATPEEIMSVSAFSKATFKDTSQAYGITRIQIALENGATSEIEVATYRRDVEAHLGRKLTKVEFAHLEDDLERRDFTINALALDPHAGFLIDLHDGLNDLEHGLVRFIGEPAKRIAEDPLRLVRAVRFRNQLGFEYDPSTKEALISEIKNSRQSDIATDRLQQELTRMLLDINRRSVFEDMDELGLLEQLMPELAACKNVQQPANYHAEGDVWEHTLRTIDALPEMPSPRLAWAALLHDIGKPSTMALPTSPSDRIRFSHHHEVGARLANDILLRLKFSNKLRADITWLIHYHLITDDFPHMRPSRRQYYMSHAAFGDLLELHKADIHGSIPDSPKADDGDETIRKLEATFKNYLEQSKKKPANIKTVLGINGEWLKKEFGLEDGPKLGHILRRLQEAFIDGEVTTIDQASKTANQLLQEPDDNLEDA